MRNKRRMIFWSRAEISRRQFAPMPTSFRHPKRKIALARENIKALERHEAFFFSSKPYAKIIEPDDAGFKEVHKVRLTEALPDSIFNAVDQIIGALRAALDKACYATSRVADPKNAKFPIADHLEGLMDVIRRKPCKDLEPEILAFLLSLEPYQRRGDRGNDLIWAVNRLCNTDKHRNVEPYGIASPETRYNHLMWGGSRPIEVAWGSYWDRAEQELILLTVDRGANLNYDISVTFCVALQNIEGLSGKPAIPLLRLMIDEIERVVLLIEAEAVRLGLTP